MGSTRRIGNHKPLLAGLPGPCASSPRCMPPALRIRRRARASTPHIPLLRETPQ